MKPTIERPLDMIFLWACLCYYLFCWYIIVPRIFTGASFLGGGGLFIMAYLSLWTPQLLFIGRGEVTSHLIGIGTPSCLKTLITVDVLPTQNGSVSKTGHIGGSTFVCRIYIMSSYNFKDMGKLYKNIMVIRKQKNHKTFYAKKFHGT